MNSFISSFRQEVSQISENSIFLQGATILVPIIIDAAMRRLFAAGGTKQNGAQY